MNLNHINIDKSIRSEKLIYKDSTFVKFVELLWLTIFITALSIFFDLESIKNFNFHNTGSVFNLSIFLSLSLLIIYSFIQSGKLKREKNLLKKPNQFTVETYLEELIKRRDWNYLENSEKIKIIDIPFHDRAFGWHKRVYIIFDKKDLLINISSYGLGGTKLPLTRFCNSYLENKILKKMKRTIKTRNNNG